MAQNTTATDEPYPNKSDERDEIQGVAQKNGLHSLVYYGSEPLVALVDRDKSPSTSYALQNEKVAVVEWASGEPGYPENGWAVSITSGNERKTNPECQLPEEPDMSFSDRTEAVNCAAEIIRD